MILCSFENCFVALTVSVVIFVGCTVTENLDPLANDERALTQIVRNLQKEQLIEEHLFHKMKDLTTRSSRDYCRLKYECEEFIPESTRATPYYPRSCKEAMRKGEPDGVRKLHVAGYGIKPFYAYCLQDHSEHNASAWTVVLFRETKGRTFHRKRLDYKNGFGCVFDEHFLGLDYVYALTNYQRHELLIQITNKFSTENFKYSYFLINNAANDYMLISLGNFSGKPNAEDSFRYSVGYKFSTSDKDFSEKICSMKLKKGAWWFFGPVPKEETNQCSRCCLTNLIEWEINGKITSNFTTALMVIRPYL